MATGVFDLLHPGHVYFLREARKLGDELVVVVARDSTARKVKHDPITPEASRVAMVAALKPVDRAVLGHEGDIYEILDELRPDIIVLGYDQAHREDRILEECRKRGLATKVVRLPRSEGDLDGTRRIVRRVGEWLEAQRRVRGADGGKAPRRRGPRRRVRARRPRRAP
ncbi:MAG TPA: adenylyltransferase/cytidyltransferase family protein [Thermoplasmata archaeon]|nr:adenylyltransferase/cytidyltransferase family protein [Thermoplasmata archaeon]